MTAAPHPSWLVGIGIAALIAWRLYSRVRRMVGRQRLSRVRPWVTVILFPLLFLLLLLPALAGHPASALALVAGAGIGVGLGIYGLKLTRFEATPEGLFYTPSAHLGIALSALLIARLGYRAIQIFLIGGAVGAGFGHATTTLEFSRNPLTAVIFATLAGYYVSYAIGLLRWRGSVGAA